MTDDRLERRLKTQEGVVSVWQLRGDGLTRSTIRHATAGFREVHDGVLVSGHGPLTDRQRWWAAALTAPDTVLAHDSAGRALAFFDSWRRDETVVRPGSGGPKRFGSLVVYRSTLLTGDTGHVDGLPITSPARTVLDLVAGSGRARADRVVRDALRLGATDAAALLMITGRHRGRRGVARLRALAEEYAPLPVLRANSDAELLAMAILQAAGVELPALNVMRAGHEADLSWAKLKRIIELDGGSTHMFPTRDARIQAKWERAGWHVDRLSTDDVYDRPDRLLALAPPPAPASQRSFVVVRATTNVRSARWPR